MHRTGKGVTSSLEKQNKERARQWAMPDEKQFVPQLQIFWKKTTLGKL